ncbi:Pantothenate synthetase [Arenibacter antarcticus]|uniref:Pantothenate synthetase n=1 Tax=Arenibacter antarcticus TaxID=2040469 RepID=A0ABW5VKU3_9FLAO|nr:pantoate--beta-alanine ligase [Arenibacter sp. H213]MCM4166742.1 pantoate--beta-alanine ligase [Arenibacter sp. H213]
MQLINTIKELDSLLKFMDKTKTVGLVPTMGALHMGHISLIEQSVKENDHTIVSIFVNPTQFNNKEDLAKYPNTLNADISLLKSVSDSLIVLTPTAKEIYSGEITSKSYDFNGLENVMEGAFREGHFNGVATIVEKLLSLTKPTRAYFGEKDFQQLQIIRKLVQLKNVPVEIIGCPIVRESNGLAMSSRNERLSKTQREDASFIYKTLKSAKEKFGTNSANSTIDWLKNEFLTRPEFKLEYIKISDEEQLLPVIEKKENSKYRAFIAVYMGDVRLIDNIAL